MANFIIVGLDHFLQNLNQEALTEEGRRYEADQQQCFAEVLEETVTGNGVTLICEECKFKSESLGSAIAGKHNCRHVNITTPHDERERLGIPQDYENDPVQKARATRLFEEHMASAVQRETRDRDVVLLMVGDLHRNEMQRRMAEIGTVVEVRELRDFEWYEGPPVEEPGTGAFLGSWKKVKGDST
jgi:hypothetical protein